MPQNTVQQGAPAGPTSTTCDCSAACSTSAIRSCLLKLRGQPPELFYSTFALRCVTPMRDDVPLQTPLHQIEGVRPCVHAHLGPELERIQPAAVIAFGYLALATVALYLSGSLRYTWGSSAQALPERGAVIPSPAGWRHPSLLVLKAPALMPHLLADLDVMFGLLDQAHDHAQRSQPSPILPAAADDTAAG